MLWPLIGAIASPGGDAAVEAGAEGAGEGDEGGSWGGVAAAAAG